MLPWLLAGLALMLVVATVAVVLVATREPTIRRGRPRPAESAPSAESGPESGPESPTTGQTTPPVAASLAGNWRGNVTGDQTGFDVVAQISDTTPLTATVQYPQLGCAGTWTETSRQGLDAQPDRADHPRGLRHRADQAHAVRRRHGGLPVELLLPIPGTDPGHHLGARRN